MRYLTPAIQNDLKKKMVLLSGPRQTGKTTLSKELAGSQGVYLNWDIRADQKIIREVGWPKKSPLVILDELHKYPKWKNYLKELADAYQNRPPLLITGSARLEAFRHAGDALTGRYFHYRLHPIDLPEARAFLPQDADARLRRLLQTGGFPEAFLHPKDADRLRNLRFDLVLQEDLRDLSKTNSLSGLKLLIELLRERVGGILSYLNLSQDLGVSPVTVKHWIQLLERLFVIFLVPPYAGTLVRSLRREQKFYFYDCAAAYAEKNTGARLENAVACSLLKYCHFQRDSLGKLFELHYFRDREKREVDFVVTLNRKPFWCVEVKTSDADLSPALAYLHQRFQPKASFQLVQHLDREQERTGIRITSLAAWLDEIF